MKKSVLVVDDSATVRKFIATSLQLQGFKVLTAADGMEALETMPVEKIDLIITDLNMPDMDGFEFIKSLQATAEYASIPIIVLSSITDPEEKKHAYELGAFSYLEKPFNAESIQREVKRCISRN